MYIHTIIIYVLKSILKFLIFGSIFSTSFVNSFAQNFELTMYAKDSVGNAVLKSIPYNKVHQTKKSVLNEVDRISHKLTSKGYLQNQYQLTEIDTLVTCEFELLNKIEIVRISYPENSIDIDFLNQWSISASETYFDIPFNDLENTLNEIVGYFENSGHPFTTVSLSNILEKENTLRAQLNLIISDKRTIDNVVIKGYPEFPKKYIKQYLGIKPSNTFNLNLLNQLNALINTIPFVSQIKKPEVLFTKDSTNLYLYLKKKSTSSFDGIIGFSNEENSSGLKFNGYLDLNLNNILNKGESFNIHWENSQQTNSSLELNFNSPFIFNSKLNLNGGFSIFKQDTSFVNTKGTLEIGYALNQNNTVTLMGSTEKSDLSSSTSNFNNVNSFNKKMLGIKYVFSILENPVYINRYKFYIDAGYLIGNRISDHLKKQQNIFHFLIAYNAQLNTRNAVLIKTSTQYLNTTNPYENELFRIGGVNSIRGFNEQSILTPKYNVTNLEYHFKVNTASYLYTITDFAILNNTNTNKTTQLYGLGIGYYLSTKNTILNLSYAVGTNYKDSFNLNNSKLHIKVTYPF